MVAEIFAGISSFKEIVDLVRSLKEITDATRRGDAIVEIQAKLVMTQQSYFLLDHQLRETEEKLTRMEAWEAEKKRYDLVALHDGALAYSIKEAERGVEPVHYLCTNCYADGKKSILQGMTTSFSGHILTCQRCKAEVTKEFNYPD